MQFLVSAGEASGDLYASGVVSHLASSVPAAGFYGCAGPRLQTAGVEPVVDAANLAVVGLAEVIGHLPRIYREYRKLLRVARDRVPQAALLTDSPDFHLRLARHLKRMGVPVFYLVAPQVWAWRQHRVKTIRERVDKLFCIFPFEEAWFRERGVDATYIGHPLAGLVARSCSRDEFCRRYQLAAGRRTIVLLPGSRPGEARRHMPDLLATVRRLQCGIDFTAILAVPPGFPTAAAFASFREPIRELSIQVIENDTWNCIGHADLALAASGTVTIEAAMLGTPMVTFYKVNPLSWRAGRRLVKVPFLSMVNLVAGRGIVPEFIQDDMNPQNLEGAAGRLLREESEAERMRVELARVRGLLTREGDPLRRAAECLLAACGAKTNGNGAVKQPAGEVIVQ